MPKSNYAEFSNPKLASIYNGFNQHYPLEKEFYLNLAKDISAQKIIDVGCGTGLLTLELAKLGYKMVGVEPAKSMLEIAYQNPLSDQVKWIHGDALVLDESNADLAIMTAHVAQFLLEDEYFLKVLNSINKSLKVGGYLAFDSRNSKIRVEELGWPTKQTPRKSTTSNGEDMIWWAEILESKQNRAVYEVHYYNQTTEEKLVSINELIFRSQEEITKCLNQANFEVENVYGDWDKTQVTESSPEFIFVARKMR
jgi:ubiquinone/menaquinone biosynthesis C-methylase UbiE